MSLSESSATDRYGVARFSNTFLSISLKMKSSCNQKVMNDRNLNFKIDTKEKMHVITLEKADLTANMTEEYKILLLPFLDKPVKNLVLNLSNIQSIEAAFAQEMVNVQQQFYENDASLVVCCIPAEIMSFLKSIEVTDVLNYTPTESEAWDIVQMEEIERELF